MANKNPTEQSHGKRFDQPVNKQGHTDAAPMGFHLMERSKIVVATT